MPIYGYACKSCDHSFDALQKMSAPRLTDCPECGQSSLQKQLSAPKFRLKGQGWYETDFKTGDKRNLAADSDGKSDKESKEPDKSSDKSSDKSTVKTTEKADSKKTETKSSSSTSKAESV